MLRCPGASVTLSGNQVSGARSHSIETQACYVIMLSNQQAVEVIKQVNHSQPGNTHTHTDWTPGRVRSTCIYCTDTSLFTWHTEFFFLIDIVTRYLWLTWTLTNLMCSKVKKQTNIWYLYMVICSVVLRNKFIYKKNAKCPPMSLLNAVVPLKVRKTEWMCLNFNIVTVMDEANNCVIKELLPFL